jgi:hypothetical protein
MNQPPKKQQQRTLFTFLLPFITLFFFPVGLFAQNDTIHYDLSLAGLVSTGQFSPFWLQSYQYGKVSANPFSTNLMGGISKEYGNKKKLFDYGFKADLLVQVDKKSTIYFHELYAKARFSIFDMAIGAREEHYGNQDSTLSGGGFLFSKNARPIPKVFVGIERFTTIPFTFSLIEIKGGISHGWFTDNIYTTNMLLHHKFLYGRLGGKLPVHIQYGLDHVAEWGGNVPGYGQQPTQLKDFLIIYKGKAGGSAGEAINALGNHIISQSIKLEVDLKNYKLAAYWQNISEDGPIRLIGNTMNSPDGLGGFSIKSRKKGYITGILYEYLQTTDQSGPYHDKDGMVYGGSDSYFYNYVYNNGWSNYSRIIGTPFISSAVYNKNGEVYTLNNRVIVHHFGVEGSICGYNYKALTSFSKNYGTYGIPKYAKNTSTLLEINKQFPQFQNIELSCSLGADFGQLYGNSTGLLISVRKRGNLLKF